MLKLKNISKVYKTKSLKFEALNNVSIDFREKEFVSILGESGSGKTTLLNIVGGLDFYTEGDLIIDNISTKDFKSKDWDRYRNNKVGFVFQEYNLINHLSILDNVELALKIGGMKRKIRKQKAKDMLIRVGLKDHITKKPGELSGGQRQRVAIARALINEPDVILADEPTGALDSQTSIEVMNILKEIGNEKLVIMVTHNEKLAQNYSNRIITLKDGKVINDTNPYSIEEKSLEKKEKFKKTSMSYFTAILHSIKNLFTKKFRTFLTALAGSIGIIGIALTLSLKNGLNAFIDDTEKNSFMTMPIQVGEFAIDLSNAENKRQDKLDGVVGGYDPIFGALTNNLNKAKPIIEEKVSSYASEITYQYGYAKKFINPEGVLDNKVFSIGMSTVKDTNFSSHFNTLAHKKSNNPYQAYLYVNENNRVPNDALIFLGFEKGKNIEYNDILGKTFKAYSPYDEANIIEIEITSIEKSKGRMSLHNPGICYNNIVNDFLLSKDPNPKLEQIDIYTNSLENKDKIKEILDLHNKTAEESDKIHYMDLVDMATAIGKKLTDALSIVLIIFSSISLVVSSIMISIIVYTSVLERIKEIGILRSIGARKKDIVRIFISESVLLGFFAGLFGILLSTLIIPIINVFVDPLIDFTNTARFNIVDGLILLLVSMVLTFISGFIPSLIASRKHPVDCIRN